MTLSLSSIPGPPGWRAFAGPFTMIRKRPSQCFRFLFLNLVFGLLGVYVSLLVPAFFSDLSLPNQLQRSLNSGDFYAFIIAFLSSTAVLLIESQPKRRDDNIWNIKTTLVVLILALVIFSAIGSVLQMWVTETKSAQATAAHGFQWLLFILGVLIACYCFLVAIYEDEMESWAAQDDAARSKLTNDAAGVSDDGRGVQV